MNMFDWENMNDQALLAATRDDAEAFGTFYGRHERRLLSYLVRRTRSGDLAADLCAETFAAALQACRTNSPIPDIPVAWLFGIANHKVLDSARRSQIDDRARRALEMRVLELTDAQVSNIERLCGEDEAAALVAGLTHDQREALLAHVVDEREYRDIATQLRCSESVIRKRVSRGLASLRVRVQESR
jgi:RNA polymerase sigma-70 factor (ECF subfamily)